MRNQVKSQVSLVSPNNVILTPGGPLSCQYTPIIHTGRPVQSIINDPLQSAVCTCTHASVGYYYHHTTPRHAATRQYSTLLGGRAVCGHCPVADLRHQPEQNCRPVTINTPHRSVFRCFVYRAVTYCAEGRWLHRSINLNF